MSSIDFAVVVLGSCVITVSAFMLSQTTNLGVMCYNMFFSSSLSTMLGAIIFTGGRVLICLNTLKSRPVVLKRYAELVAILLTVVLLVGVIRIFFSHSVSHLLIERMTSMFDQYGQKGNEFLTLDLDAFQNGIQCCGIIGYRDWANFTYGKSTNVADGCCRNQTVGCGKDLLLDPDVKHLVYTKGCLNFVTEVFYGICLMLGILSFFLICLEAVNIVVSYMKARSTSGYETLEG